MKQDILLHMVMAKEQGLILPPPYHTKYLLQLLEKPIPDLSLWSDTKLECMSGKIWIYWQNQHCHIEIITTFQAKKKIWISFQDNWVPLVWGKKNRNYSAKIWMNGRPAWISLTLPLCHHDMINLKMSFDLDHRLLERDGGFQLCPPPHTCRGHRDLHGQHEKDDIKITETKFPLGAFSVI